MVTASDISTNIDRITKGFVGFIRVWERGQLIYSESCKVVRLTAEDALQDAKLQKAEILELNGVN